MHITAIDNKLFTATVILVSSPVRSGLL
jgi:hypothetical protein